ncbi:MAG: GNAT family N-acetyltransferase [Gemmatimonadaceae bacterium]
MTIERLAPGDEERLRTLRFRSLRDAPDAFATTYEEALAWPSENWSRQLEHSATFVAMTHGSDLGLVRGALHDQSPDTAYVISMWVAPEVRRQGVGSALVDAVVDWARAKGVRRLLLDVSEQNTRAITFYIGKGFAPTGEAGTLPPPREHVRNIRLAMIL